MRGRTVSGAAPFTATHFSVCLATWTYCDAKLRVIRLSLQFVRFSTSLRHNGKISLVYWHIIYQTPQSCQASHRTAFGGNNDGCGPRGSPHSGPGQRYLSLDAIGHR